MSRDIIKEIVNSHPDLNDFGFGLYFGYENESDDVKAKVKFAQVQRLLDSESEFCRAVEWISKNIEPTRGKKKTRNSYGLKHDAEKEIGYLTNGVFISAMIYCGYPYRIDGPNAIFNVNVVQKHEHPKGGVYIVRCSASGLFKIGTSKNIQKRISQLQTSSPGTLDTIAIIPCEKSLEKKLHSMFSSRRVRGEWFDLSESDLLYISTLISGEHQL